MSLNFQGFKRRRAGDSTYPSAPHEPCLWRALHNKAYLIWKIREAQKGRIPVGPRKSARREGVTFKVLPLRLESDVVDMLDEVWRKRGLRSRTEFLRTAMQSLASSLGEPELAGLLGGAEVGGEP